MVKSGGWGVEIGDWRWKGGGERAKMRERRPKNGRGMKSSE